MFKISTVSTDYKVHLVVALTPRCTDVSSEYCGLSRNLPQYSHEDFQRFVPKGWPYLLVHAQAILNALTNKSPVDLDVGSVYLYLSNGYEKFD